MSKQTARSWKLVVATTTVLMAGALLVLNFGAAPSLGSPAASARHAAVAQPSGSSSPKSSTSPKASTSPSPEDTCTPGPDPLCIPGDESSAPASSSPSPSTSPTPGGGTTYKSEISIDYSKKKDSFVGKVDSKTVCEKGRRVDLFKVSPGKDQNLAHTLTQKKGKYVIPFPKPNGRFYTKVRKSTADRKTTCKGAQSKTIAP
jgi:hypothetical protein